MNENVENGPPNTPGSGPSQSFAVADVVEQRRNPRLHLTAIIGILALLGAGVFAVKNVAGNKSGGDSPEAAVRALFQAASHEDIIGVLQHIAPGERDAIREPLERIRNELVRLRVLDASASLTAFPGIDLEFDNLTFASTALDENVATVQVTGGTFTSRVDPARLPFGAFARGLIGGALKEPVRSSQAAGDDTSITAVRVDGRWYASLFYTIAESGRLDAGAPKPAFGKGVPAQGAASSEKAIDAAIRALAGLDVERLIALTPPDEMAALHDYASLFVQEAGGALLATTGKVKVTIAKLELDSEKLGADSDLVFIRSFEFKVTSTDGSFTAAYDGKCLTTSGIPYLQPRMCGDDLKSSQQQILPFRQGKLGFVAVERDGQWFLSPTRTILEGFAASLKAVEPGDLDKIAQFIGSLGFSGRNYVPGG